PLLPSDVAVIVVEPATTPVTRPLALTVPTEVLLLAHVTVRPVSVLPFASFGVAVSWTVCPACTEAGAGLTVTDATGTSVTVTTDVPLCPSDVAVIVVEPATLAGAGLTVTDATGTSVTVTTDVPLCPSDVAVIVVEPATTPVTRPLAFTVPTEVLLLAHVTVRPVNGLPLASFGVRSEEHTSELQSRFDLVCRL